LCPEPVRSIYNHMVVDIPADERTDRLFHALADATRRDIVRRALEQAYSVSSLARHYPMSYAAVQKHVAVLEAVGLITKERRGRKRLVRTDIERIREAARVLDRLEAVWRSRIERMDDILAGEAPSPTSEGEDACP
jgi:DNA-binding transcriptional ArsR family regulator